MPTPRGRRHATFGELVAQEHARCQGRSGRRLIRIQLQRRGVRISAYMTQTVMHELGLRAVRGTRQRPKTAGVTASIASIPNRLWTADQPRCFASAAPGVRLVGDTTEFDIAGQRVYLHIVLDLYNRAVLGWSLTSKADAVGVIDALTVVSRQGSFGAQPIFHSDRGSHFMSRAFQAWCSQHGVRQSMGEKGKCYDNAVAESFFATFKGDLPGACRCTTISEARTWITEWIETWYNTERPHSWNNGLPPRSGMEKSPPLSHHST